MARVVSFGYKFPPKPQASKTLDARIIDNPYVHGTPDDVMRAAVLDSTYAEQLIQRGVDFLTEFPESTLAVGCSYGRHRSVAVADEIARRLGLVAEHLSTGSNGEKRV